MKLKALVAIALWITSCFSSAIGQQKTSELQPLQLKDIFELEFVSDPQVSPDGKQIAYMRVFHDIMTDRSRGHVWLLDEKGQNTPLLTGEKSYRSPRWSPDGKRIAYVSTENKSAQIFCLWLESGRKTSLTKLQQSPGNVTWSPDGKTLAFTMAVPEKPKPFAKLPAKPKGAKWADPPILIDRIRYRADGAGYLPNAYRQIFTVSAMGGTPRQITEGKFNHGGSLAWTKDSKSIIFSANRNPESEFHPRNSDIYSVELASRKINQLTDRNGPDSQPVLSSDGTKIYYLGFDDKLLGHQHNKLYEMSIDGSGKRQIAQGFNHSFNSIRWSEKDRGLVFSFDHSGESRIGFVGADGKAQAIMTNLGGTSIGRPYSSGSYSVSNNGEICFTYVNPSAPARLAKFEKGNAAKIIVDLNKDLLSQRKLGKVEEVTFKSSFDKRDVEGWIIYPPDFDKSKKYPLILEIHGGPYANYGPRFTAELQLYAAKGYVVLYINPRGSTSYGEEFANLIQHNYPGQDYDDLMSGVDHVIAKGIIDTDNLFVTGGSGGGVLTSWIVGKTNRFTAAVVAKPVINWYSFALTADMYTYFYKYWFPGLPWEHRDQYMDRSPISLVGNVKTPTMLLTGEADYRTPISETEQYYQALKLQKVKTAMVRIPGASHGIGSRPSHLIAKVAYVLQWFENNKKKKSKSK